MPRISHLEAPSASKGMATYLRTCASSGLPHVVAVAEEYAALPKAERMKKYLGQFEGKASWGETPQPKAEKAVKASKPVSRREQLLAELAELDNEENTPAEDFAVGVSFTYTNKAGTARVHKIESIRKGYAVCDSGLKFKVATLRALTGTVVSL